MLVLIVATLLLHGEPLDLQVHSKHGQVVAIEDLLGAVGRNEIGVRDIGALVVLKQFNFLDLAIVSEYLKESKGEQSELIFCVRNLLFSWRTYLPQIVLSKVESLGLVVFLRCVLLLHQHLNNQYWIVKWKILSQRQPHIKR